MNRNLLSIAAVTFALTAAVAQSCQSRVPHGNEMSFELKGKHAALSCEACHGEDEFGPLPAECQACHEEDRPPNHYEGDCGGACHTEYGWLVFNEPTTTTTNPTDTAPPELHPCQEDHTECLPLVDAHDRQCLDCHPTPGQYGGLEAVCTSCHEDDRPDFHYEGQDCEACHTPTAWGNGEEHPITLPHNDAECLSCHPAPEDRAQYTCYGGGCHDQADTDYSHANVYGYVYDAAECWACHPDGSAR